MRLKLLVISGVLFLFGCVHDYPLVPKPEQIEKIDHIKITYVLPKNVERTQGTINGLNFLQYEQGSDGKVEKLYFNTLNNQLEIKRRTDNNIAVGSGVIYTVNFNLVEKSDSTLITFIPQTKKTYQQGLVLPFPVPSLDLETYLSGGIVAYKFEIDSNYPPTTVEANLQRLMGDKYRNGKYRLDNSDERFEFMVKIYPYKHNQSKVSVSTTLYNKKSKNGIIDIAKKINSLKIQIQNVVNA